MATHRYTLDGITYEYDYDMIKSDFVDSEGNTCELTSMGFYHRPWQIATGCTTPSKIFKWIKDNFRTGSELESIWYSTVSDQFGKMIDHAVGFERFYTGHYHYSEAEEWCRSYSPYFNPHRMISKVFFEDSRTTSVEYQLINLSPTPQPETEVVKLRVRSYGMLEKVGSVSPEVIPETKWNKYWNYSKKMEVPEEWNFFRGKGSMHFGMELEVSTKLDSTEIQYIVENVEPKQEPFFIFKQDGSITGKFRNYYELVTVPCSPKYLRNAWRIFFEKLTRLCEAKGHRVEDYFDTALNLNNGLHIHISRKSFSGLSSRRGKTLHQRKFVTAFNLFDESAKSYLTAVAKRTGDLERREYCSLSSSFKGRTLATRLRDCANTDMHRGVVNNAHSNTIEVRVFQGYFNLAHILECITFTEAMVYFTDVVPFSDINRWFYKSFEKFASKDGRFKSLVKGTT